MLGVVENMSGFVCECCGEGVNIFGKGGGEVMAGEFGVRFLGRVPVDGQWGVLVEEGRRPLYRVVENNGEDGDGEEDGSIEDRSLESDGSGQERREEGLLVDKYRSCALKEVFEGITGQLINIIESRTNQSVA